MIKYSAELVHADTNDVLAKIEIANGMVTLKRDMSVLVTLAGRTENIEDLKPETQILVLKTTLFSIVVGQFNEKVDNTDA